MGGIQNLQVISKKPLGTLWKSSLKASILANFVLIFFLFLLLRIFLPDNVVKWYAEVVSSQNASTGFSAPWLPFLAIGIWALYGVVHKAIPVKQTIVKVFVFNLVVTGLLFVFGATPHNKKMTLILFPSWPLMSLASIGSFVGFLLVFTYLFDHFTKTEETEASKNDEEIASITSRVLAFFIDCIIIVAGLVALLVLLFVLAIMVNPTLISSHVQLAYFIFIPGVFAIFLFFFVYWVVQEGLFGVTIGKRFMGIRVVKENCRPIGYQEAFFRNIWKLFILLPIPVFDCLPMFFTKRKQRFFDMLASTVVVTSASKSTMPETYWKASVVLGAIPLLFNILQTATQPKLMLTYHPIEFLLIALGVFAFAGYIMKKKWGLYLTLIVILATSIRIVYILVLNILPVFAYRILATAYLVVVFVPLAILAFEATRLIMAWASRDAFENKQKSS